MLHQMYPSPFLPRGLKPMPNPLAGCGKVLSRLLPKPILKPYLIDPLAFIAAILLAPLLVALFGFWALLIPVFAVVLGGPLYLLIGVPLLLWYVPRNGADPGNIAWLAFKADFIMILIAALYLQIAEAPRDWSGYGFFAMCSLAIAPFWGGVFGKLYQKFERGFYRNWNA